MSVIIAAKELYKCYTGFAPVLRGVDMTVEEGELVAIMGPSGCGKSTMLHVLGMLHAPDSGSLQIMDVDVLKFNREETAQFRRGNMGFVMQSSNLFEHSTVFENVEFPLIFEKVPPQERWERVIRALELVRLSARVHYRSNRLSGGEQQRVAIARAMVNNPKILLADEPTGALDAHTSKVIMENFRTLCHNGGVSMVMVTHDPKMAEYCDSIYTLEEGILQTKKHSVPKINIEKGSGLLGPISASIHSAFVLDKFPNFYNRYILEEARCLHSAGIVSRMYTLQGGSLLGYPEGYALPIAIRYVEFFDTLKSIFKVLKDIYNSNSILGSLWKKLPSNISIISKFHRLINFAKGVVLSRLAEEDGIEFIYAIGTNRSALSCLVASCLLNKPFAFQANLNDLPFDEDLQIKIDNASFICCTTNILLENLKSNVVKKQATKLFLSRSPLVAMPSEEDISIPNLSHDLSVKILVIGKHSLKNFISLFKVCAKLLETTNDFVVNIVGCGYLKYILKFLILKFGLRKNIIISRAILQENIADIYKSNDIYIEFENTVSILSEAMAFEMSVISYDKQIMKEYINNNKDGLLISENNNSALYEAIKSLVLNKEKREKLGREAKKNILKILGSDYDISHLQKKFQEAIKQKKSKG